MDIHGILCRMVWVLNVSAFIRRRPYCWVVLFGRNCAIHHLHNRFMDLLQAATLIILAAFAMAEGFCHAILYGRRGHESFNWNEHWVFTAMRALMCLALIMPGSALPILSGICMYPFFHNGMYYTQRDRIDGSYPKRWWDMTKSSSANTNFTVEQRTILAAIGLILFMVTQAFHWKL